jgi:acetyl-CoA C-acetyltransferase
MSIIIAAAKRSAIGSFNGTISQIKLDHLNRYVFDALVKDIKLPGITQVIMGHVLTGGFGQNTARQTAVACDIPYEVTSYTVNQVCGSGMKAIMLGYQSIIHQLSIGIANPVVLAGGHEIMSQAPHNIFLRSKGNFGDMTLRDSIISDGLTDVFNNVHMGITAENLAKKYAITRKAQDEYAYNSQMKASKAQENGVFDDEIAPIKLSEDSIFNKDEFIRHETSIEKLSRLKTAFIKDGTGTVTAGNASGINDGSAMVILMTEKHAKEFGIKPLARIVSFAEVGVDPMLMGIGPVSASEKALQMVGWNINDLDLIEVNEAFAAQTIAVNNIMCWDTAKVNVNGGAIALGHPIGASGARIVVTLVHELRRRMLKRGLATACVGGGMGVAMCVETL